VTEPAMAARFWTDLPQSRFLAQLVFLSLVRRSTRFSKMNALSSWSLDQLHAPAVSQLCSALMMAPIVAPMAVPPSTPTVAEEVRTTTATV
jgi:hypothetical protein